MKPIRLVHLCLLLSFSPALFAADTAELDCLVRPETYIDLSSPVDTTLKQLMVEVGDTISKGQPLVRLENSVEYAKVELHKRKALSFSEIENRRVQLQYAKRNLKRMQELLTTDSASKFEKDKAETEVALAEIELIRAKEYKNLARLSLEQAEAELSLRTI